MIDLDAQKRPEVAIDMNKNGEVWLVEPNAGHPLSDPHRTDALIAGLPGGDSLAVLEKITEWIGAIVGLPDMPLQRQLDLLDQFDRLAKNHQLNLVPEYLDTSRMRKLSESRLWTASFEYWRAMGEGYLHCMRRFQAADPGASGFRQRLPVVVCRAIRSLTVQLKWTLLRYAKVEERIWRDLCQAYMFSARWDFSARRSPIYPGKHGESSAQAEILKALMLHMSAPDALTPLQQHIAERLVAFFSPHFAMHTTAGPGCSYVFDMSMHVPPSRARKGAPPAPLLRFFGPGTATERMRELSDHLVKHGTLPPDTPVGGNFSAREIQGVLDHLLRCWSESPPSRRGKRRATITRLTVVPGLANSILWLQRALEAGNAKIDPPAASESWVVVEASDGGYGAVVSKAPGDWLTVGALVCVRSESAATCRMGLLRRISAGARSQHRVGMQLIGEGALPVALFAADARNAADPAHSGEPAILMSRRPDPDGAIELLLRPGSFLHNNSLRLRYRRQVFRIEYLQSLESNQDHHWARFRVVPES